jgi:predicted nucleic acid-binding protein
LRAVVADASALVEYLLKSDRSRDAAAVIEAEDVDLHTAGLCDVEVVSALRGLIRGREIDLTRAHEALEDYAELPVSRHGHVPLLARVLELRDNLSAYDATYVALAEALSAELLTCDAGLAAAVRKHAGGVRLAADGR